MTDIASPNHSSSWRDADSHAEAAARYLEMMTKVLEAMKRQTIDSLRLASGSSVVEIGCGIGRDAEAMAALVGRDGRVVGLDASQALIDQARERTRPLGLPLEFQVGDAHALAFPDNSFDAARVDRVLQHLAEPMQAVREMVRVVRPGGKIAVLEPDWETVSVAGGDIAVTRAVVRYKSDLTIAHGRIGRDVRRLLIEAGCRDVMVEMGTLTFGTLPLAEQVMSLRASLDGAREANWLTPRAAEEWWRTLEASDRAGSFFAAMSGVIAGATVPG